MFVSTQEKGAKEQLDELYLDRPLQRTKENNWRQKKDYWRDERRFWTVIILDVNIGTKSMQKQHQIICALYYHLSLH